MVNYGIIEVGVFIILVSVLAYYSLHLPMIISAAIGGLGILIILMGILSKQPANKAKKSKK